MTATGPQRSWGGPFELKEMLEGMPGGMRFAVRDFALLTLAGKLAATFPEQLVFKGGFVLRHGYQQVRFSKDVDATRHQPPQHKFEADDVAAAIRDASIRNVVTFSPSEPATDSARSLDFETVRVTGDDFPDSTVQVEVSYREGIVRTPVPIYVGEPFYEPFEILTMAPEEMIAEKVRTLAQRIRPTDLADLAVLFSLTDAPDTEIKPLVEAKFELVAGGNANRGERIEANLDELAHTYDDQVPGLFPDAPSYAEAREIVWPRIKCLIP